MNLCVFFHFIRCECYSLSIKVMTRKTLTNDWWMEKSNEIAKYTQTYLYSSLIAVFLCLSIIQIRFSIVYADLCPIDDRIIFFLFVLGLGEEIYSIVAILVLTLSFFYKSSRCRCRIFVLLFINNQVILIVLLIGFLIGNYLVFHVKNQVQSINSYLNQTYCHDRLYQIAFWTIIIDYILMIMYVIIFIFSNLQWFIKPMKRFQQKFFSSEEQ